MRQIIPVQHKDKRRVGLAPPFFVIAAYSVSVFILVTLLGGCSSDEQRLSFEQRLSAPYDQTTINESLTLDVLPKVQRSPEELGPHFEGIELLSKGRNVVALVGQSKDGYLSWFNMFTFHEHRLNVIRKYFYYVDDRTGIFLTGHGRGLMFDCEMVLPEDLLDGNYAAESERQIAILKYVLKELREDIDELESDAESLGQNDKMLSISGMLMNQTFEMIFLKLESSPMFAGGLSSESGVEFQPRSFNDGKIQMVIENDIVKVKIRLGELARWMGYKQKKSRPVSRVLYPHR
jgi:hypothetical protein